MKEKKASLALVQSEPVPEPEPLTGYEKPPKHFNTTVQKNAWLDLVARTKPEQHTAGNYFAFEIAATLLAKFRAGTTMNATEGKELKKQLIALGLAKADDDAKPPKSRGSNAHYFE